MSDSLSFYILFLTAEVPFSGGASIGNRPFNRYGGYNELSNGPDKKERTKTQ